MKMTDIKNNIGFVLILLTIAVGCATNTAALRKARASESPIIYQYRDPTNFGLGDTVRNVPMTGLSVPRVITRDEPEYPVIARQLKIEGQMTLHILVDEKGDPQKVVLQSASNEIFVQSALEAAQGWKFVPLVRENRAEGFWATIEFRYLLVDGHPVFVMSNDIVAP
jgi:TonB family protein